MNYLETRQHEVSILSQLRLCLRIISRCSAEDVRRRRMWRGRAKRVERVSSVAKVGRITTSSELYNICKATRPVDPVEREAGCILPRLFLSG